MSAKTCVIGLALVTLLVGCSSVASPSNLPDPVPNVDGNGYTSLDAAFSACNVSPGCELHIPPGTYSFAKTQIAPRFIANISGSGAWYDNAGPHCITTLVWTGTGTPLLISGSGATGTKLSGFCLYAGTGASSVSVLGDIDSGAGGVDLEGIVVDYNTMSGKVLPTVAAFRWGNTGNIVDAKCNDVFVRNVPVAYDILNIESNWTGSRCRSISGSNTTNEWVIGSATALAEHVICRACAWAGGDVNPGVVSVVVNNAVGVYLDGEWECGDAAAAYCLDVPSTAMKAQGIKVSGTVFGQSNGGTVLNAVFHTNLSGAQLSVGDLLVTGSNFATTSYVVKDDACSVISLQAIRTTISNMSYVSDGTACDISDSGSNYNGIPSGLNNNSKVITNSLKVGTSMFSSLATCASGIEGSLQAVTDSTTNAWGATITGSGANHVLAYCDGTNWTVVAK